VTLILSVATPTYSLQVSDRLVSRAGDPYDPLANKNVVLRATDGPPRLRLHRSCLPRWDANRHVDRQPDLGRGLRRHRRRTRLRRFPVRDVGSGLLALSQTLQGNSAFRNHGGEICTVGWPWDDKRTRCDSRSRRVGRGTQLRAGTADVFLRHADATRRPTPQGRLSISSSQFCTELSRTP
jgi:hypothetical protein